MKISLSSSVLSRAKGNIQGKYELSETVNGKQSWVSIPTLMAIWYDLTFKSWKVGPLSYIGTHHSWFYSVNTDYDCPHQIVNRSWTYFNGYNWSFTSSNDISFHCDNTGKEID